MTAASATRVAVQFATGRRGRPSATSLRGWAAAALARVAAEGEMTIRLVDRDEGAALNATWRGRPEATNVLSFPLPAPPGHDQPLLGDIVICAPVVEREADDQHKPRRAHWAHLVVHGVLHLAGYDHQDDVSAARMESLEIALLAQLGYPDPYHNDTANERRST